MRSFVLAQSISNSVNELDNTVQPKKQSERVKNCGRLECGEGARDKFIEVGWSKDF